MRAIRKNLLLQFSIASFVLIALVMLLAGWQLKAAIEEMVLEEASADAVEVATRHISNQLAPEDFQRPMLEEQRYHAFNDYIQHYVTSNRIARVKLWNTAGQVIYSNDRSQIGQTFPIEANLAKALKGGIGREISEPQKAESEGERYLGTLIEVYVPVRRPGSDEVVGAYEVYQFFAPYDRQTAQHTRNLFLSMAGAGIVLYTALFLIVLQGWRTIQAQGRDIDRQLREVTGLNNLFRLQLAERDSIIASLQQLCAKGAPLEALNREGVVAEYNTLKTELQRLTEEASHPSVSDSPGGQDPSQPWSPRP